MKLGHFNMHKWASSDPRALEDIPLDCRLDHTDPDEQEIKVLGLTWNYSCDYLKPSFSELEEEIDENEIVTKREVLSAASSIWDPAGMVAPFTFLGKLIMQKIWQITELTWDSQVQDSLLLEFQKWRQNLKYLREFKINRCVVPAGYKLISLMIFGDASKDGYCSNVYTVCSKEEQGEFAASLQPKDEQGEFAANLQSHLVFAKARVSPLKVKLSIPRLELLASLLAARSCNYVRKAFEHVPKIYLFSDSEITLWRLTKPAETYKIWLGSRLEEIHQYTDDTEGFHWVSTELNPSDIGSRGSYAQELCKNHLWLHGPEFIRKFPFQLTKINPSSTLNDNQFKIFDNDEKEIKKIVPTFRHTVDPDPEEDPDLSNLNNLIVFRENYSTVRKILCWVLRFIRNCKLQNNRTRQHLFFKGKKGLKGDYSALGYFTQQEKLEADYTFFRQAQRDDFSKELEIIQSGEDLPKKHELNQCLPFFCEETRLLRMQSRLRFSEMLSQNGAPIILPRKHEITKVFVKFLHYKFYHASLEMTISLLRRTCWLTSSRRTVKSILYGCSCRDLIPLSQQMSPLPAYRLEGYVAWRRVSIDYFGPIMCKVTSNDKLVPQSPDPKKCYGLIWTCTLSRAIQIDIVESLETDEFLCHLRQLVSRRGKIEFINSDNAAQFLKASKELKRLLMNMNWRKIQKESNEKWDTQWVFSESKAPWYCGTAERCIRTVKETLRKTIAAVCLLSILQLRTLVAEIEAVCNDRPLGLVYDSVASSMIPISPSELSIGRRVDILPSAKKEDRNTPLSQAWATRKHTLQMWWRRWQNEYLLTLSCSQKWHKKNKLELAIGQYVQIRDPNTTLKEWKFGVINKLIPSKDGLIRRVEVRTTTPNKKVTLLRRPIQNICVFEHDIKSMKEDCILKQVNHTCNSPYQLPYLDSDTEPE